MKTLPNGNPITEFNSAVYIPNKPRQGRPPTLANRTDLHISVSADLRERLRAESLRTGESEAEIARQGLEGELERRIIAATAK